MDSTLEQELLSLLLLGLLLMVVGEALLAILDQPLGCHHVQTTGRVGEETAMVSIFFVSSTASCMCLHLHCKVQTSQGP